MTKSYSSINNAGKSLSPFNKVNKIGRQHTGNIIFLRVMLLLIVFLVSGRINAQCSNYQVYESIGTAIPTSGGTWASTSMTYGTTSGTARTGLNYLIFNAAGDIIRTPQIANPGVFSFWYKRSSTSTGTPLFTIETSPDNTAWTSRGSVTPTATYQQYTLSLSALSLTNVYVRIVDTRASGAAERYVDDISWTSTTIANDIVVPAISSCSQTVTCGTTYSFSDAGTTNDTYNVSTDYTITFTPSVGTNKVQLVFSAFDTENNYDGMVIYNGPTTVSPTIPSALGVGTNTTNCPAGSYYGTTSPGTITSTDATGAITIRFRSDLTTNNAGWLASVSCLTPPVPTITSLGSTNGCVGSSITINGTNLSGATPANVQIGGTAVSSITSNSGTVLVAVIGTGTTGTVTVTTAGGTATSGATFTVNPLPATPGNQTSNSPQCNPPGVTLTRAGSVPAGETWYWQTTALGTTTTSSAATYVVTTSGTYYIRSQNNTTGCWSTTSGSIAVVVNAIPSAAITPSPTTAGTGVCYSGSGAITNISWAATAGATSYDVYFGAGSLPGTVTSNVATNSYTTGTLLANTTYYWKVVAKNACGSAVGSSTWTFTTSASPCSCASTSTSSTAYFSAFSTTGGTTNISNSTGYSTNGYGDFTSQIVTQIISGTVNYSTTIFGISGGVGVAIFVDWNQNGDFTDSGDNVYNSAAYLYANPTGSFTVPAGASLGTTRMRIVANYFSSTPVSCNTGITGETEDYSFTVTAPPTPTITSLGSTSGCVGSSITINGTNLSGATVANVKIGGTAVSSITSNSGTVLVAVIGTGTTGTVTVTTAGGTATSAASFTVNPLPATPGNPTSNSPQCNPPGVTLTRAGSVPAGETWYWQTTALGTTTTSSASTYVVITSGTYYIRSQNNTTGCWSVASGSLAVVVDSTPTAVITPSPTNTATGICFSGSGAITSVSWAASAGATSYDVYFGAGSLPGSITSNVTTSSYTTETLLANTTYYWKVVAKNSCGNAVGSSTWTFTTLATTCYCTSTSTSSTAYFSSYSTTGGTTNITNNASGYSVNGYGNFTAQIVTQVIGGTVNFSTTIFGVSGAVGVAIFVDWNQNGDFADAGDNVYNSAGYISTSPTGSFTVPAGATLGTTRMRIVVNYYAGTPVSCNSAITGETEDYSFTITAPSCYSTTVNAATNVTSTTATINWNAATVAPSNGYQYVVSTSSTTPAGAGTAAAGLTANITGLTANTTYYVFVRSDCGAGNFSVWSPYVSFYTGYCSATSSSSTYYINNFSTTGGTANITNNGSGYSTTGYGNFTAQTVSQVNSGIVNFSTAFYDGFYTYGFNIWVDWNDDLDFNDTGELVYASGAYVIGASGTIAVPATASVGNHRMRIAANYFSTNPSACGPITSGETEDYTFTVLPPLPCSGNPSGIAVSLTSQTTSTVNWTAASPAPANGYQYFLSTTNTYPSSVTGSTTAGITTVNLTGLTALTTYYVWVRSNCGGALGQGVWIGPVSFTQPNCSPGSGTGTTTLGCPFVTSGGIGLNGSNPPAIDCTSSGCVDLEATYLQLGQTTNYSVQAIPYAPPYQYNCLQNPISVSTDDVWSPVINLPFNFCYYGNSYSSCIVGSNGMLSFNTGNANLASGYAFSNNLPSTTGSLFANTIYGVYHDIDPGVGGEVGWELITLNTGCRALVASWSNVPMFSNNTILYTGMMVLYENTNVIEVYIKEKNVDNFDISPWNGGNAIVGVQNAAGTAAVVAPGRNGLDTNWEVANEAWRFTPSGASIATLKWYEGSGTAGTVVGTTDILHVCPTATTTYTAEVTYSLCNGTTIKKTNQTVVTVINGKVWNGSVSTDWNVDNNWTPSGVPTSLNCVVIPNVANDPIIYGPSFNAYGLNLTVLAGATLQINSSSTLKITDFIRVDPTASFTIKNSASLVQVNDTAVNTGNIIMERTTHVRNTDYVYWSSPVANFSTSAISPGTSTSFIFKWHPTIANSNGGEGNWVGGNETMIAGKGYIVRGPNSYTSTAADYTAVFTGVPFNGIIQPPVSRGNRTVAIGSIVGNNGVTITPENDNWNLVGNPYPSAIKALDFLSTNLNIVANVRLWRHGLEVSSAYSSSFYATYGYNYSPTDYINYNGIGPNPPGFNGYIGAGQGFFVAMNDGTATTENVTFNNSMRSNTYSNSEFFRANSEARAQTEPNKHRIWLSLLNASTTATTTLIGYTDGATYEIDRLYDAPFSVGATMSIYSLINDKNMIIQGRPTPFDPLDKVQLGVKIQTAGTHNIALSLVDGLFENANQGIYLEDTLLGIIHDLRVEPYLFTADAGIYNSRFILRYTNAALGNNNPNGNQTYAFITNNHLQIQSNDVIKEITIYDITGKLLKTYQPTEFKNHFEADFNFANGAYIAKIKLESGSVVSRKLLH